MNLRPRAAVATSMDGSLERSKVGQFEYDQLESTKHIRLIELLPGHVSDPLACRLTSFLLEASPPYHAISYTWGDGNDLHAMSLNEASFAVTTNVRDILDMVQRSGQKMYVWIDAVCINQSDKREKEAQIAMMGDIYHHATNVVIWLGHSDDAPLAMGLVRRLSRVQREVSPFWIMPLLIGTAQKLSAVVQRVAPQSILDNVLPRWVDRAVAIWGRSQAYMPWWLLGKVLTPVVTVKYFMNQLLSLIIPESTEISPEWHALINLLQHPWFERVWVVQEVIFASSAIVLYGSEEVSLDDFQGVVNNICSSWMTKQMSTLTTAQISFVQASLPSAMIPLRQMHNMRIVERTIGTKENLHDLLIRFSRNKSTEPKDKIFALMGLSLEAERDRLSLGGLLRLSPSLPTTINYARSDRDVFVETARNLLTREASAFRIPLCILPLAGIGYPRLVKNLPSWVPDWSNVPPAYSLAHHLAGHSFTYRAAGSSSDPYFYNSPKGEEIVLAATGVSIRSQNLVGMLPGKTTSPFVRLGPIPDSIELKGILTGKISHLGDTWQLDFSDEKVGASLEGTRMWREQAQDLTLQWAQDPYPTGEDLPEVFWRTLIGNRTPNERPAPPSYRSHGTIYDLQERILLARLRGEDLSPFRKELVKRFPGLLDGDLRLQIMDLFSSLFATALKQCTLHRRFCVLDNGYIGAVPAGSQKGDLVFVIEGAETPFVLRHSVRKDGDHIIDSTYELIGECYVHGMMDGEMMTSGDLKGIVLV
ncbi:hypothetical protein O988_01811 [Pseudogymnoascus sp. VKM F-3808]|nr:hypothetical protein O988_01811 [Pseudogymnoascus sp. VKM F-3808]